MNTDGSGIVVPWSGSIPPRAARLERSGSVWLGLRSLLCGCSDDRPATGTESGLTIRMVAGRSVPASVSAHPTWSPNGKWVAAALINGYERDDFEVKDGSVFFVRVDGSDTRRWLFGKGGFPSWRP